MITQYPNVVLGKQREMNSSASGQLGRAIPLVRYFIEKQQQSMRRVT